VYTEQFITERTYLKGVSPATIQWYRSSFKAFDGALDSKQSIIIRIAELRKTNSPGSINTYLRCVNAYFRWLHEEQEVPLVKIPRLKEEHRVLTTLTPDQVQRLLAFKPKGTNLVRAHTLAMLLLDTGMRFGEVLGLRWESVDLENLLITVAGKGGKQRVVPMSLEARKILFRWRQKNNSPLLFPTRSGVQATQRNVGRDFRLLGERVGITGLRFSPHTFRHTFAVSYLRAGGNVLYLQRILGHSSLEMTNHYTKSLGTADLQAVHDRLSMLTRLRR
jgi:integrase/recombinase XerD